MNIEHISKNDKSELETIEVMDVFKNGSLEEIKDAVERAKERLFTAWASVDAIDSDNEKIPIEDIIESQQIILKRGGTLNDMHTNRQIGRMLAYRVLPHPISQTTGVLQLNKVFNDNELDDKVWNETVEGKRTGLSVGGHLSRMPEMKQEGNRLFKVLAGFQGYETSSVYSPANKLATNVAVSQVAKSAQDQLEGRYFVVGGDVYEIVKKGQCLDEPEPKEPEIKSESTKSEGNSPNVLNEIDKKQTTGENNMTEKVNKADILDVAIQKMDNGEQLSEEEKSAVKSLYGERQKKKADEETAQPPKEDNEEETEKADGEQLATTGGDKQPEDNDPEAANEVDVAKTLASFKSDILKSVKETVVETMKSQAKPEVSKTEKVASTPSAYGGEETAKTKADAKPALDAVEVAKGSKKMSWTDLHNQVKKMGGQ